MVQATMSKPITDVKDIDKPIDTAEVIKGPMQLDESAHEPALVANMPEPMTTYFKRLRTQLKEDDFAVVDSLAADGLYVGKRPILGAQGQGALLNQAGSVLQHTLVYVKSGEQVVCLDFGPAGSADVTANIMEAVPCGPVLHDPAALPEPGQKLLHIRLPHCLPSHELAQKALKFSESRKYHAIQNNCIQNTDFFVRVLTAGRVRNAPLIYDALCGTVPAQDHPMLLMFFLMTQLSWFNVCDGSPLMQAFLQHQSASASALQATGVTEPDAHSITEKTIRLPGANGEVANGKSVTESNAPRIAEKPIRLAEANGKVVNGKSVSQAHTGL